MTRMPVVFVSHGAPDALLKASDAVACWREIGQEIPRPAAILAVSSHWEARRPTLSLAGDELPVRHQPRFAYGGLAMDAYVW
jgi:aromatic ring-opening dioxygenase catalytic subunit (LigB family)